MTSGEIRLGIVGCGAVTEKAHLPAAAAARGVQLTALIDRDVGRAAALAGAYNVPHAGADVSELAGRVDAVILAVPHALHARMGADLLGAGVHILVEKPMAVTAAECDRMIEAARLTGAVLAVGLMRRFSPAVRFAKDALDAGCLGRILSFEYREGQRYDWPVASDFMFRKEGGGGVLMDTGAHTLDTVLWLLGDVERFEYCDDAEGGVEADCELRLIMASGAVGLVELSRTRQMPNRAVIRGERADLEFSPYGPAALVVAGRRLAGQVESVGDPAEGGEYQALMAASLNDWLSAVRDRRPPLVTGAEGRRSVALLEACYQNRRPLAFPWLPRGSEPFLKVQA